MEARDRVRRLVRVRVGVEQYEAKHLQACSGHVHSEINAGLRNEPPS